MRRIHLFEFTDIWWCPTSLRVSIQRLLAAGQKQLGIDAVLYPVLRDTVSRSQAKRVVDLCSGAGGVWSALADRFHADGTHLEVILTDREADFSEVPSGNESVQIVYMPVHTDAVAAARLPDGLRTVFNGLHHFRPSDAEELIRNATMDASPLAVFEVTERTARGALWNLLVLPVLAFVYGLTATDPMVRRWTYCGVLPMALAWDGFVSCLRTYTPAELKDIGVAAAPQFQWEVSSFETSQGTKGSYLLGFPKVA